MSDTIDDYRFLKEIMRNDKQTRFQGAGEMRSQIIVYALDVQSKNGGHHWIVRTEKSTIDFWPHTGRWIARGKNSRGREAGSLLDFIKMESTK